MSDGRRASVPVPALRRHAEVLAAQFVDYDNDGLLDLLAVDRRAAASVPKHREQLDDGNAPRSAAGCRPRSMAAVIAALALGDLDGDGDSDIVLSRANGGLRVFRNDGGNRNASLRTALAARVSNRSGVGAKVEMRAGSLRQMLESSSSSPAVAPADLIFGLGNATGGRRACACCGRQASCRPRPTGETAEADRRRRRRAAARSPSSIASLRPARICSPGTDRGSSS